MIQLAKSKNKKEFLITQKEAFPNLNLEKQSRYFDLKLKNKEIFILFENGNYIGHLCFGKHLISPPFARSIFIEELAVKKKFQKHGFGTLLINYLIKYCKKNRIKVIYTSTGDYTKNKTHHFYEKIGFKKLGFLKDIDPNSEYKYGQIFFGRVLR